MPVEIFIMFAGDVSRTRHWLFLPRISRMNVRTAALILSRKIFFWPNNGAGRNPLPARDGVFGRFRDTTGVCPMEMDNT